MPNHTVLYVVRASDPLTNLELFSSEGDWISTVREAREKRTSVKRAIRELHPTMVKLTIHKKRLMAHHRGKLRPGTVVFYEETEEEQHVETLLVRSRI